MNPLHLESLLAIVDEGSFEAAAHSLGVTPSAVSQRIKALEKDTGRVLVRRTSPATATDAGEILVQAARRMRLLQAETDARLQGRLGRVPLSVAVNADSLATWFTPVFADVATFGEATLRLRIEDETRTLSLLRRGDVLGAVTRESRPVSGCETVGLGRVRYRAVATPELAERYPGPDWSRMPTLRWGPSDELQARDLEERLAGNQQRPRMSDIPSTEALVSATLVGMGWGLMSELQADPFLRRGDLVLLDDRVVSVALYWQRWRLESELLERLTDSVLAAARVLPAV
ncbi:chromosome replication initiation inhibitor protein [Corynebacterium humireducens NBRC 106098 = DSM 45392]|uniref:Chromosome replication initiation inhibitor protein n=1 Tax=Corynebacterium humireducens NBRC 106098 = DSM 45392 TaxID=1223515 RepID=A0A0B5D2P0_9CORY|nr:LysR family transcriptional regulator ArgP [Corynebacterium humireducens]AJE32986.1 chromosome replication initiation inhibitor protein [Corynebacterium humireducens NBRC 106098 = DSM 45392]